jgi:hypothetical protein
MMAAADAAVTHAPAAVDVAAPAVAGAGELCEADLAHVIGGLARAWVDDTMLALPDDRDLVPREGR